MKANIRGSERVIRIILGLVIIMAGALYRNWWGAVGLIPLITGLIGWCGLYQVCGKSACGIKK
jgi:hypothetical protein